MLQQRLLGTFGFAVLGLVVFAVACDDHDGHRGRGAEGPGATGCELLTSCGTCTPVTGCGWCETPGGQGLCASDPDECANVSAFSWTWDPTGCRVIADAGGVSVTPIETDGGPIVEPEPIDAGGVPIDASIDSPVDASGNGPVDASDASDGS
jgi:hypothetical protein